MKNTLLALICAVVGYIFFLLGQHYAVNKLTALHDEIRILNKISSYEEMRSISILLSNKDLDSAKCRVDLLVSNHYDDIRAFINDRDANLVADQQLSERAAEIKLGSTLGFSYYPMLNGIRECNK